MMKLPVTLNIKNPFVRGAHKDIVGIDMSSAVVKVVHARVASQGIEIVNVISRSLVGLTEEDQVKAIRSAFAELVVKGAEIIDVIPGHLVISKNIEIPSVNSREISEIINLQAGRHTPYTREEIIVDYIDIGTYKHSYTKILLIILARQVVKKQFEILQKAGLRLEKIRLAAEGMGRAAFKLLKLETETNPIALVHIDANSSDFLVVFKQKSIFLRSIPLGATHLAEDEERSQARFSEEIKRSLEAYQSEDVEHVPAGLMVTGAVEEFRDIATFLGEYLHLNTRVVPYAKNIVMPADVYNKIASNKHVSFFAVIACLYVWQETKINLVPEEIKVRKAIEERARDLVKTGIYVLLVFMLINLILISKIYFGTMYLNKLERKYRPLHDEVKKLEVDFSKVSMIKNYLTKRGYSLEVLTELYALVKDGLLISDIRFDDQQGKFSIRGTAESMSLVFSFVQDMEKSNYFEDVKTKYTTKRKEGTVDVTDFEIATNLSKNKKE